MRRGAQSKSNTVRYDAQCKRKEEIYETVEALFIKAEITKEGLDLEEAGLEVPAATWTYLINESKSQFSLMESFVKFVSGKMKK